MKMMLLIGATILAANAEANTIRASETSRHSGDDACSLATDKAEKLADAQCRQADPNSFLSSFRRDEYRWLVLPNGTFRCDVTAFFSCY